MCIKLLWPEGIISLFTEGVPALLASSSPYSLELWNSSDSFRVPNLSAANGILKDIRHQPLWGVAQVTHNSSGRDRLFPFHGEVNEEMALLSWIHLRIPLCQCLKKLWTAFPSLELLPTVRIILLICSYVLFCFPEKYTGGKHIHLFRNSEECF